MENNTFNRELAIGVGNQLGINWKEVSLNEFTKGMNVELEHGKRYPETNITNDDPFITGKITWAHLKEFPDYYTRLENMEEEAHRFWEGRREMKYTIY